MNIQFFQGTTDYSASVTDVRFTASSLECVNITIVDDNKVESNENFLLILHTTDQAVVIDPQYAFVTILDDDTKTGTSLLTFIFNCAGCTALAIGCL